MSEDALVTTAWVLAVLILVLLVGLLLLRRGGTSPGGPPENLPRHQTRHQGPASARGRVHSARTAGPNHGSRRRPGGVSGGAGEGDQ